MIGKTHRVGGLAFGAGASCLLLKSATVATALPLTIATLAGGATGAVLADIDHKGAEISKKFPAASWIARQFVEHRGLTHDVITWVVFSILVAIGNYFVIEFGGLYLMMALTIGIMQAMTALVLHYLPRQIRKKYGLIARAIVLVLSVLLVMYGLAVVKALFIFYSVGIVVGYASHLFLDSLNPTGIHCFGGKFKIRLASIRTGEHEKAVSAVCYIATVILLFIQFSGRF